MRGSMFVAALVVVTASQFARADGVEWLGSETDALAKAKETSKPVLLSITSDDTESSTKLKTEIFASDEFTKWAAEKVVLAQVNLTTDREVGEELMKRFELKGLPAVIFLDAEGKDLGHSGYMTGAKPKDWIADANQKLRAAKGGDDGWLTDYKEAQKRARAEGKLILADFTGSDWCSFCIKLHDETFDTQDFKDWASANVVLLVVDHPRSKELPAAEKAQNDKLDKDFPAGGFPNVVFIDGKGKKKGEIGGYKPHDEWMKAAKQIAGNKKPKKAAAATPPGNGG